MDDCKRLDVFFQSLDRAFFMDLHKNLSHLDSAIEIGYGQTISQPSLVLFMTKKLDIRKHHKILEIGTGSGYQTAFLAEFGKEVFTIERIEPLHLKAQEKLSELGYGNIHYILGDGTNGLPEHGPYDRIIVTAAARSVPETFIEQLNEDGKLIIPVGDRGYQDLLMITKDKSGEIKEESLELVRFVPLIGKYGI